MQHELSIAEDWFIDEPADELGVRQIRQPHVHEYGGCCIWLVEGSERCLLVEAGVGVAPLRAFVEALTSRPIIAFASLGYYDHAGGLHQFNERLIHQSDAFRVKNPTGHVTVADYYVEDAFSARPYGSFEPAAYRMPASEPTRLLSDGDSIDIGDRVFQVMHSPGVTAGACALFEASSGALFAGEAFVRGADHVYDGEPADRSDDADRAAFCASIKRLARLPSTTVYRGHYGRSEPETMQAVIASYLKTH